MVVIRQYDTPVSINLKSGRRNLMKFNTYSIFYHAVIKHGIFPALLIL